MMTPNRNELADGLNPREPMRFMKENFPVRIPAVRNIGSLSAIATTNRRRFYGGFGELRGMLA